MSPSVAVFRVLNPISEIGAQPGDHLLVQLGHPTLPFLLQRDLSLSQLTVLTEPDDFELVMDSTRDPSAAGEPSQPQHVALRVMR